MGGLLYGSAGATALFLTSGALTLAGAAGAWYALRGSLGGRESATALPSAESNGAPVGTPQ